MKIRMFYRQTLYLYFVYKVQYALLCVLRSTSELYAQCTILMAFSRQTWVSRFPS